MYLKLMLAKKNWKLIVLKNPQDVTNIRALLTSLFVAVADPRTFAT